MLELDLIQVVRNASPPDGVDVCIEVCGHPGVVATGIEMLRTGGRYIIGGLVNPKAELTIDGNLILRKMITLRGIHNYHPRQLIPALDFVMANRMRFSFEEVVDSKFSLDQLDEAFWRAGGHSVMCATIMP